MTTLDIRHLGVRYASKGGTCDALSDVNLTMRDGDFVVALGASGCGKTTLLNCIAGLHAGHRGRDRARRQAGRRAGRRSRRRVPEARADALAQRRAATSSSACACAASRRPTRRKLALDKLRLVGLQDFAARRSTRSRAACSSASGIARALARDPEVMLMDEPLGALDALTREPIQELILDVWHRTGKMIFFITHSVEEALFLATELIVMTPRRGASRTLQARLRPPLHRDARRARGQVRPRVHSRARGSARGDPRIATRPERSPHDAHRARARSDRRRLATSRAGSDIAAAAPRGARCASRHRATAIPGEGPSTLISVVTVVALLALWWIATHFGWVAALFLPTPEKSSRSVRRIAWRGDSGGKPLAEHLAGGCSACSRRSSPRASPRFPSASRWACRGSRAASSIRRSSSTVRCRRSPTCR